MPPIDQNCKHHTAVCVEVASVKQEVKDMKFWLILLTSFTNLLSGAAGALLAHVLAR